MWAAYLDESESIGPPPTYTLAAALVDELDAASVREQVQTLRRPRQKKLHWRDEDEAARSKIADALANMPTLHLVVVRVSKGSEIPERRRRKCLERLIYELTTRGVLRVVAEARGPTLDGHDLRHLNYLRRQHAVPGAFRIDHCVGHAEPLLWMADAVAGATTAAHHGDATYLQRLSDVVEIITLDP